MSPDAVDSNNIIAIVDEVGVLPKLSNSNFNYIFTFNNSSVSTKGILTFGVALIGSQYSGINSAYKNVSLSGFSTNSIPAYPATGSALASFMKWVNSLNG